MEIGIPVIASHWAISGLETLQELSINYDLEGWTSTDEKTENFNAWNINICDEDIVPNFENKVGIFGLFLWPTNSRPHQKMNKGTPKNGIQLIWENIEGIFLLGVYFQPNLFPKDQKLKMENPWRIGTDFEGFDRSYRLFNPSALEFDLFSQ